MRRLCSSFLLLLAIAPSASLAAQSDAARYLEAVKSNTPAALAFLRAMPKGGDLHSHLSGSIYAETYIRWAAEQGLCFTVAERPAVVRPPCDSALGRVPAARALTDERLRARYIDGASMRNWHPSQRSGDEQFFGAFGLFSAAGDNLGGMIAEVAARAAASRVRYLELMHTADERQAATLGTQVGWHGVAQTREQLLDRGLRDIVASARLALDTALATQRQLLGCAGSTPDPGCAVEVRFLYQVLRNAPPERVFAQILMGFELASVEPRVVGLNLVQPEHYIRSMGDYALHMQMIGALRGLYPGVKVTLHAGELAPGLVPPEGLRFHIRDAVDVARAERIGHGVDIGYEDGAEQLLQRMAAGNVLVEIALGSNDAILGVRGQDHPLRLYLERGVPVTLATDDEGVLRSDLTLQYLKAVQEQGIGYEQLKEMARNSLRYSFADDATKTRLLAELERDLKAFEARFN